MYSGLCKLAAIAIAALSVSACSPEDAFHWQTEKDGMYLLSADKTVVGHLPGNASDGMTVHSTDC
ncbi:MAG: hypothetical protein LBK22_06660 [Tannerella sp.]|jgi:hypothetical protein|nr:hypothetical protein [Tannerella sp.]